MVELKTFQHNGYTIKYYPDYVFSISTEERDHTAELLQIWDYSRFRSHIHHLYDNEEFQQVIKDKIYELFKLANELKDINGELYCYICSHVFNCLSSYGRLLMSFHLHLNANNFWLFILKLTKDWENGKEENEVHKGTIYGYIAEVVMHIGDYEIAFTYLHRAVREDFTAEKYIKDYGRKAPGYKIITLRPDKSHWMSGYVNQIREGLKGDIVDFNNVFTQYAPFEIEDFDKLFIENEFFDQNEFYENLKITASYYIWSAYYYSWKVDRTEKSSTFDNLSRLPKLFGICVTIESLANQLLGKEITLKARMSKLYKSIGGAKDYEKNLHPEIDHKDHIIDSLLKELLNYKNNIFAGIKIDEIDRCVLIYSLIRNFSAHNVKSIEMIGNNYFLITQSLLFLFLVFLIELNKAGKIR